MGMGMGESFSKGVEMGGSDSGRERALKGLDDSKGVSERGAVAKVLRRGPRDEVEGLDERLDVGGEDSGFVLETGAVFFFFL